MRRPARLPVPRWMRLSLWTLGAVVAIALIAKLSGHVSQIGMH